MKRKHMLHLAVAMSLLAALMLLIMALVGEAKMALLIAFLLLLFIAYSIIRSYYRAKLHREQALMKLKVMSHAAIAALAFAAFFALVFFVPPIGAMAKEAGMDKGTLAAVTLVILAFSAAALCSMQNRRTARLIDSMIHDARDAGDNRMFIILEEIKSTMRVGLYATWMVSILLLITLFKEAKLTLLIASLLFLSIVLSILLTTLDHRTKGKLKKIGEDLDRRIKECQSLDIPEHLKN